MDLAFIWAGQAAEALRQGDMSRARELAARLSCVRMSEEVRARLTRFYAPCLEGIFPSSGDTPDPTSG